MRRWGIAPQAGKGKPTGIKPDIIPVLLCSLNSLLKSVKMVGQLGLEPRTYGLKARCSTN